MTGDVFEGYDEDLITGQDCIDDVVRRFAAAEKDDGHRTYDPADTDTCGITATGDTTTIRDGIDAKGEVPEPKPADYNGPTLDDLRSEARTADRSLRYHALVRVFCDGCANVLNWRLEGAAAAIGAAEGRSIGDIDRDLARVNREGESVGYDRKTIGRIEYDHARAERGEFAPPSWKTLVSLGVLPPAVFDVDPVAVLPPAERNLSAATSGWDWKHADRHAVTDSDPMEAARERTTTETANALDSLDHALVEALPTLGKSYGAVKAVAETGKSATVLTGRGNVEQYDQFKQWCDEFDLNAYTLPAFTRDCPTANGEHSEDWYDRGATPQEIHAHAQYYLDQPLPCQAHDYQECPYSSAWRFDPDNYDILLGHYTHAYNQSERVTVGRGVPIDEFPGDAFERTLGGRILKLPSPIISELARTFHLRTTLT